MLRPEAYRLAHLQAGYEEQMLSGHDTLNAAHADPWFLGSTISQAIYRIDVHADSSSRPEGGVATRTTTRMVVSTGRTTKMRRIGATSRARNAYDSRSYASG